MTHQVRNIVGTLIRVGTGKITIEEFKNILEMKKLSLAGPTAPAQGLCLIRLFTQIIRSLNMKTYAPKASEIERKWHLIDANGQTLGRLSYADSQAAHRQA